MTGMYNKKPVRISSSTADSACDQKRAGFHPEPGVFIGFEARSISTMDFKDSRSTNVLPNINNVDK
jgi:hypothetical protein